MSRIVVAGFLFVAVGTLHAQVASVSVERQKLMTQTATNALPFYYRFNSSVVGNGIQASTLQSPATKVGLAGNAFQQSFSTNFAAASLSEATNFVAGLTNLNASFPVGSYSFTTTIAMTNPITKKVTYSTNDLSVALTNDFPAIHPLVTNIAPFTALAASQTFAWPVFTTASDGSYANFTLFEGEFDTNIIASFATNGLSAITNFAIVGTASRLAPTANSTTIDGINTELDHLAVLEFHAANAQAAQFPVIQAQSTAYNIVLYLDTLTAAEISMSISTTNNDSVVVSWSTNATSAAELTAVTNLSTEAAVPPGAIRAALMSSAEPLWSRITNAPTINQDRYEVVLPADRPRQFFRLKWR